ncbi:MAG TPA: tRNA (adenosine(37)-N6)-threonylcarbamoyltransferase complex dimerization subunit type 1 TsaB [Bacteroidia bacterium]|jgi:tRNA threonylcarbamoyladenosine biosynthesis protein TsaB|nr:tRNA (adenosine(37)-N6)-threonylcarbamoyltransferase complex dimerization subunit type 1 TsaB [Bacteroidia bacterium]
MGLILNLETATTVCSVALAKDGQLIAAEEVNGDYTHAENLNVFIEQVLQKAKLSLTAVDAIAISKGPGSYTGLRIGVSTAKGLCYALDKPLIAINTLEHSAYACAQLHGDKDALFCPMIDARRMEVYCALFDKKHNLIAPTAAVIIDEHSFEAELQKQKVYFFGDGAEKCKDVLSAHANAVFIEQFFPSAKNMVTLSENAFNNKQFVDVAYFEPLYLKDFVAGKKKSEV